MLKTFESIKEEFGKVSVPRCDQKGAHVCMLSAGALCPHFQGAGANTATGKTIICVSNIGSDEVGTRVRMTEKTIPEARSCLAQKIAEAETEPETPPGT